MSSEKNKGQGDKKILTLLRHGESEWTRDNLFCGWVDVKLTKKGQEDAIEAANELKKEGFKFDLVFTSLLRRATDTAKIVVDSLPQVLQIGLI